MKLCSIERKILEALKRYCAEYWNLPEVSCLIGIVLLGFIIKKLTILLIIYVVTILFIHSIIKSKRKNIVIVLAVIIFIVFIIYKPTNLLNAPKLEINLGVLSIPTAEEGNIAPLIYTLFKYIKYDPITSPRTAYLVIQPISFRLKYNPKDDIYHGEYVVFIKNIGHSAAIINKIEWDTATKWNKEEMKLTPKAEYYRSELNKLNDKKLPKEEEKIYNNYYNNLIEELECKGKILRSNDEIIFSFSPQLQSEKPTKGIFVITVVVDYRSINNENKKFKSQYNGYVEYNKELNMNNKIYKFINKKQRIDTLP